MTAWTWVVLGLALAAIELATPGGFFIIFFGVAALVVGLVRLTGLLEPAWSQWLAFPVLALVALRVFRRPLLARMQTPPGHDVDAIVGEVALPVDHMDPGGRGKVEVRGARWNAHNIGNHPVGVGDRCRVVAVNGLELDVRPADEPFA